ncbi:MAG: hypothetical protein NW226_17610 [Microscillaceae bacterium]|nr:hypothetical protein [Microscillaceae bacterium]
MMFRYLHLWYLVLVWLIEIYVKRWKSRNKPYFDCFGRHDDPCPVICSECGWLGASRDAIHTYATCVDDNVEP